MRQHFLSDLLMGVRGKVTLGIPPFPNKTVGTPGSSGLWPLEGFVVPKRNAPLFPNYLEKWFPHVPRGAFKTSKLVATILISLLVSSHADATLTIVNEENGQRKELQPGEQWIPFDAYHPYPILEVSGKEPNIYDAGEGISMQGGGGIIFMDASTLSMKFNKEGISVANNTSPLASQNPASISGEGFLEITTNLPTSWSQSFNSYFAILVNSSEFLPEGNLAIQDKVDLAIKSYRGIVVSGGKFVYYNPLGSIEVTGNNDGNSGLLNGLLAVAAAKGAPSFIDITAGNLTIEANGQTPKGGNYTNNRNELISTTAWGSTTEYLKNECDATIKVNATTLTLQVGKDYKPGANYSGGWGIYGQSGAKYISKILLYGSTFSFTSPVDAWNGIYSLSWGQENHISLDFTDSIVFSLNGSSSGIEAYRYMAEEQSLSVVDIRAGVSASLRNDIGYMVYNAGSVINIVAPLVEISSGNEIAISTDSYSLNEPTESGITNVVGSTVIIFSEGNTESSYAIQTKGNVDFGLANGFTNVSGGNISIRSQNAAAIHSLLTGTTSVGYSISLNLKETLTGNITVNEPEAEIVNVQSVDGYGVQTETKGNSKIRGDSVVLESINASAIYTLTAGTTDINGGTVSISTTAVQNKFLQSKILTPQED